MLANHRRWLLLAGISWVAVLIAVALTAFYINPMLALLLLPLGAFGIIANRTFRQTVLASQARSEQSRQHVRELSHYLAEQKRITRSLKLSEDKFRNAFDHASIGMALVSESGTIMRTNRALEDLVGVRGEDLLDRPFADLLPEEEIALHNRELAKLFYGAVQSTQLELRIFHSTREILWVTWSASQIPADAHESTHYVFQFQDITDKKRAEQRLAHDTLHDSLTGLPNRMLFLDRLQVAFRRAQRGFNINFAVCYIDFDRFKLVNDSFGHAAGDTLLVEMATRIKPLLRPSDTLARLGGDEFAILVEEISELAEILPTLDAIREEIARAFYIDGRPVFTTASIGIAPWARNYERPDLLLRDADTALYQAKRSGRNRYEFFAQQMHTTARESLQIESDLRNAVDAHEFVVFYQPVVVLNTGELSGFEALIRWNHPRRGLMSPIEFIAAAEETGLIFPIGEWVLREACRQLSLWQQQYPDMPNLWVSVNVAARQFMQVDLVSLVSDVLNETGLAPGSLKLELTESAMAENIDHVVEVMGRLKELGVRLSIDDFGTGYSSLSNLHRLPLNSLKIDKAFVQQMQVSSESDEIIKTIISLARSLDLSVIAEGLENEAQYTRLRSLECQMAQGYFISRPMDAAAAEAFIVDKSRASIPIDIRLSAAVETAAVPSGR